MAPVRRYLRITKYSVLECRIYLENPALANSWLLNPRDPVLPRVIQSVKPLVLPKLREEKERAKGKGKKAKLAIKDVVVEDEYEVSIFFKDISSRHSVLNKEKSFLDLPERPTANSNQHSGTTSTLPIEVPDENPALDTVRAESDSEDEITMQDISAVGAVGSPGEAGSSRLARKLDDKKMGLTTLYDGFSIYNQILCLIVKRRQNTRPVGRDGNGQALVEDWIIATQAGGVEGVS
ncbi:MAG: hypothetical protein M1838_001092 [Thelocarpon superellum]|nr:MAG: hypothetical protein M1838_001092 [Thelocarpon superellum]